MKRFDIDTTMTKKVSEFIAKGYIINCNTMSGSQGEVAKVDLVKGKELIRVWINSECDYNWSDPNAWTDNKLVLRVGKWKNLYDSRRDDTVWMNDLIVEEEYIFYELGKFHNNKWYLENLDEALVCVKKGNKRRYSRRGNYGSEILDVTSETTKDIAVKLLKRKYEYQRLSRDKITVHKRVFSSDTTPQYFITYNERKYYLA